MSKGMNGLALTLSIMALAVSLWTYQQADARADAALQRREKALVDKHRPEVERLCKEFGLTGPPADAQTVDELVRPLGGLVEGLGK